MEYLFAELNDHTWKFSLNGAINEDAEVVLQEIASSIKEKPGKDIIFHFSGVKTINSLGVRAWVQFVRSIEEHGTLFFEECTPDVIMQINMIPSFAGKASIVSFYTNYVCERCDLTKSVLIYTKDLPEGEMPSLKVCDECQDPMETEELEEEYFAFLVR